MRIGIDAICTLKALTPSQLAPLYRNLCLHAAPGTLHNAI